MDSITMPVLQVLLLAIMFLAILVEVKTGGTGTGIMFGLVAAVVFWGSQYVKGAADLFQIGLFLGEQGPVLTELRPSGSALLEGHPVDVVSEGAFIAKGELVRVISVQGSRVVVRRVEKLPKEAAK